MKDLDFDELDRAVNSLMTNVPKTAPRTDEEKEKTLDITPTLDNDATTPPFDRIEALAAQVADDSKGTATPLAPISTRPVPPASPIQPPQPSMVLSRSVVPSRSQISAPSSAAAPASRRGGRFMDVVHPSSDMKKPEAGHPVSRQGVSLQPQGVSAALPQSAVPKVMTTGKEVDAPLSGVPTSLQASTTTTADATTTHDQTAVTSDWPDPLDIAMKTGPFQKQGEQQADTSPSQGEEAMEVEKSQENSLSSSTPLVSPFLPDAKVEKRPLGTPESNVEASDASPTPWVMPADDPKDKEEVVDSNDQLLINPGTVEPLLPEELQGDLMAVEADTTHDAIKKEQGKMPVKNEKPQVTLRPVVTSSPVDTTPTGPTSIPQQYREEPSTSDQKNGSIYDTDDYHQPLAHPAKKKSGLMWVLWAVIVLLLGAGAGAALYYFKVI